MSTKPKGTVIHAHPKVVNLALERLSACGFQGPSEEPAKAACAMLEMPDTTFAKCMESLRLLMLYTHRVLLHVRASDEHQSGLGKSATDGFLRAAAMFNARVQIVAAATSPLPEDVLLWTVDPGFNWDNEDNLHIASTGQRAFFGLRAWNSFPQIFTVDVTCMTCSKQGNVCTWSAPGLSCDGHSSSCKVRGERNGPLEGITVFRKEVAALLNIRAPTRKPRMKKKHRRCSSCSARAQDEGTGTEKKQDSCHTDGDTDIHWCRDQYPSGWRSMSQTVAELADLAEQYTTLAKSTATGN
ncbi:hypothetical protein AURDEDRAFT_121903 [Auricularia subglabra TFB-10046 SS5]|nr:hypothetical protein AURDEDRAFT_121903 [Auricularia subglabra TFB-10046 SS5]